MQIHVIDGDITAVRADALMTTYHNVSWRNAIDEEIDRVAKDQYHIQVRYIFGVDPETISLRAQNVELHSGLFRDVIFVIDDHKRPLKDLILSGLDRATIANCMTITMPPIRLDSTMQGMLGTQDEKIQDIVDALKEHAEYSPIRSVNIVIRDDPDLSARFRRALT